MWKLWGVFGLIILRQGESFTTKIRGWSMSLKNGVVLLLSQGGVSPLQECENIFQHHVSLQRWNTVVSFSLLYVSLHTPFSYIDLFHHPLWNSGISEPTSSVCTCFPPEKCFRNCCLSSEALQDSLLSQDDCWLDSCVVYFVNSVIVMKLLGFFFSQGTKVDVLIFWWSPWLSHFCK